MSGYSEDEASSRFAGKGLMGFVEKPFRPQDLAAAIQAVLEPPPPDAPDGGSAPSH
jgi:hypothetical protein